MEQTLGFKVHDLGNGSYLIETLDEEGKVIRVKPCLIPELWQLWVLAKAQWDALAETSPK